jgi:hypothetical protein
VAINIVALATEIEKVLADITTLIKALPPPSDPTTKAALTRVTATLSTLTVPQKPTG